MKKRITTILVLVLMMCTFAACSDEPATIEVPSNVVVAQDTLSWDAAAGAGSYTVSIQDVELTGVISTSINLKTEPYVSKLIVGVNNIKVKAVKGELSSDYSAAVTYTYAVAKVQLATPVIKFNEANANRLEWTAIANASGYKINLDGTDLPGKVTNSYYEFSSSANSAIIKVKAIGENNFTNSEYSNQLAFTKVSPDAEKLGTPTLSVSLKTITWQDVAFAESYMVSINGGEFAPAVSPYILAETAIGTYSIGIKAIANGITYVDSDVAVQTIEISKLDSPTLAVKGKEVSWDNVPNAVMYMAKINDGEYENATSPFIISANVVGDYIVKVKAIGNDTTLLDSDEATSEKISITKLEKPTSLSYSSNTLKWTGNASKYKIVVVVANDATPQEFIVENVSERVFTYTAAGTYVFTVQGIGDGKLTFDSDVSDSMTQTIAAKTALEQPKNVTFSGNNLTWGAVANATSYEILIKKNGQELKTVSSSVASYTFSETEAAVYKISIRAISNNTALYVASPYSVEVEKTVISKLAKPVIKISETNKNKVEWDAVPNASEYEIYINGIAQPNKVTDCFYTVPTTVSTYNITVKALTSSTILVTSDASNQVTITVAKLVLAVPTVTGRTITFIIPTNAVKMQYQINGGEWVDTAANTITVEGVVASYNIKLRAMGDGAIYLNSDERNITIIVTKLADPILSIDASKKNVVSWSADANADFLVSTDGINFQATSEFKYTFNKTEAGTYTLYVKATGKTSNFLDSEVESINVVFTKLGTPTGLSFNSTDGKLSWRGDSESYEITITGAENKTVTATSSPWNLGLSAAGTYTVTVRAIGKDVTINSDVSVSLEVVIATEIIKLAAPIVVLSGDTLSWGKIENATIYSVELNGAGSRTFNVAASESENYTFDLSTSAYAIAAGEYTVKVCADTTLEGYTKSDYWTTAENAYVKTAKLPTTTITITNNTVSWAAVSNATSYKIFKEPTGGGKTLVREDIKVLSYTFNAFIEPFIGKIYVVAVGDGKIYIDSEAEKAVTFTVKLAAPSVVRNDNNRKFTVTKPTGVNKIMYTYTKEGANVGDAVEYDGGIAYGIDSGEYTLNIYYTGLEGYTESDKTTTKYTVLSKLTDIKVERDKISFKAVAGGTKYLMKDNGGEYEDFRIDESLSGGMHRFYIMSASDDATTLPSIHEYFALLVITNVEEFNLITTAYNGDLGNADNMWGVSTLVADIPDATGIKTVFRQGQDYSGVFIGNGHTIGSIEKPITGTAGLFGHNRGQIENLKLYVNIDMPTTDDVGGVAKYNLFRVNNAVVVKGEIKNVEVFGTIKGKNNVGGIVGVNAGDLNNCTNSATVTGADVVGGIVGNNISHTESTKENKGCIIAAINKGSVSGAANIGGIVGKLSANAVEGALNKGSVDGTGWGIGGIAGITLGGTKIFDSMNIGTIHTNGKGACVGGIVGKHGEDGKNALILNCINTGIVNPVWKIDSEKPLDPPKNIAGLLIGENYAWKDYAAITNDSSRWAINGAVVNSIYAQSSNTTTVTIGDNRNQGSNEDTAQIVATLTLEDATILANTLNAKDANKEDTFKVVKATGENYTIILAWCEGKL